MGVNHSTDAEALTLSGGAVLHEGWPVDLMSNLLVEFALE